MLQVLNCYKRPRLYGRTRMNKMSSSGCVDGLWDGGTPIPSELQFFLRLFIQNPQRMGAFAPSSKALAMAMVREASIGHDQVVVELGPGTGALTSLIIESIPADTALMAIEIDE